MQIKILTGSVLTGEKNGGFSLKHERINSMIIKAK